MTTELLREVLSERAAVKPPGLDVAGLVDRAEQQRRRRRWVGAGAAVAAAAVVIVGGGVAPRLVDDTGPVDRPARFAEPRLTFAQGSVVHYGGRSFDSGVEGIRAVAPTAYGFVVATFGTVWFTDGSESERIGRVSAGQEPDAVTADATGALAAWIDRRRSKPAEVVVYDTRRAEEVARIPSGGPNSVPEHPEVVAVDGTAVYWAPRDGGDALLGFDVATGERVPGRLPPEAFVSDVADGVVLYSTHELGGFQLGVQTPTKSFTIKGLTWARADLSPDGSYVVGHARRGLRVVDVTTGERVILRTPRGHGAHQVMGWTDPTTVAFWDADRNVVLTCVMPSGSCEVAVEDPGGTAWRPLFPGYLPG